MTAEKISLDIDIFSEVFLYLYTRKTTVYMDIYVLASMGSNRTFKDVKCTNMQFLLENKNVLIVPLWN